MSPDLVPLALAAPLLVAMALGDFLRMRIPNKLVLAMVVLFAVVAPWTLTVDDILWRVVAAGAVFVVSLVAFAFGIFAGGDVKGLSALILFIPPPLLYQFALVFSAAMLGGIVVVLGLRWAFGRADAEWAALTTGHSYPMGVSIGLAGLAFPLVALLLL